MIHREKEGKGFFFEEKKNILKEMNPDSSDVIREKYKLGNHTWRKLNSEKENIIQEAS